LSGTPIDSHRHPSAVTHSHPPATPIAEPSTKPSTPIAESSTAIAEPSTVTESQRKKPTKRSKEEPPAVIDSHGQSSTPTSNSQRRVTRGITDCQGKSAEEVINSHRQVTEEVKGRPSVTHRRARTKRANTCHHQCGRYESINKMVPIIKSDFMKQAHQNSPRLSKR